MEALEEPDEQEEQQEEVFGEQPFFGERPFFPPAAPHHCATLTVKLQFFRQRQRHPAGRWQFVQRRREPRQHAPHGPHLNGHNARLAFERCIVRVVTGN